MWEFSNVTLLIIVITAIGSGLVGAFIQAAISAYANRTQPIGRRVDVFPAFQDIVGAGCARDRITISDGEKSYKYENLHWAQIQLTNQGDQNFDEFKFGIALSEGDAAIYLEALVPDRHHQVEQLTSVTFASPQSEIDLILRPLTKKGTYSLRLFIVNEEGKEPGEIEFSSPLDVEFVHLPTTLEIVEETLHSASFAIGPFNLSFPK